MVPWASAMSCWQSLEASSPDVAAHRVDEACTASRVALAATGSEFVHREVIVAVALDRGRIDDAGTALLEGAEDLLWPFCPPRGMPMSVTSG